MSDRNDAPTENKKSAWPLFIGLPLIAVLAAAAIFFTSTGQNTGTETANDSSESAETPAPSEGAAGGEQPSLGDEDAPVVMQEFSDYQ